MSADAWQVERDEADERDRANRGPVYTRGADACRAELRRLGLPEHGPNHTKEKTP